MALALAPLVSPSLRATKNNKWTLLTGLVCGWRWSPLMAGCRRMHTYNRLCSREYGMDGWMGNARVRVRSTLATDWRLETILIVKYSRTEGGEYLRTISFVNWISLLSGKCSLFISTKIITTEASTHPRVHCVGSSALGSRGFELDGLMGLPSKYSLGSIVCKIWISVFICGVWRQRQWGCHWNERRQGKANVRTKRYTYRVATVG